jgi:hypothetical protein
MLSVNPEAGLPLEVGKQQTDQGYNLHQIVPRFAALIVISGLASIALETNF